MFYLSRRQNNELNQLFQSLSNFFNDDFFSVPTLPSSFRTDIKETDGSFIIEAELPGLSKENIGVEYKNNHLIITAEQKSEMEAKDDKNRFIHKERTVGKMSRSFYVTDIDEKNITAKYENGILRVELPKKISSSSNRIKIE